MVSLNIHLVELLFRENILLTPRVNFISTHNYMKCPEHIVRCIFSKILLSIHVETYISRKWIKMPSFRSIDWYSRQNFIRLEITRGDKWVKMLTLLLMHISTFGFNFEKGTCYISFIFVINNKNDSRQATT